MKSLVLTKNKKLSILKNEIPEIKDNECLIKIGYCGICSSDIPRIYNNQSYWQQQNIIFQS